MPVLEIKQNTLDRKDLDKFKWEHYRAVRIWRELRADGEYLFAFCVKNYGMIEETHALDLGNKQEDELNIGRSPKVVGDRGWQNDPNKPDYGKRVYKEPETMVQEVYNDETKKWEQQEYKQGRTIWEYYCKATPKMLANFKKLVGKLDNGRTTQLIFSYMSAYYDIPSQDQFFSSDNVVEQHQEAYITAQQVKQAHTPDTK